MLADLPSGGKPVGRTFVFNQESYLWLIRNQLKCVEAKAGQILLGRAAWDRAACLSGLLESSLLMISHQACFGGPLKCPVSLPTIFRDPEYLGSNTRPRKTAGFGGEDIPFIPLEL